MSIFPRNPKYSFQNHYIYDVLKRVMGNGNQVPS